MSDPDRDSRAKPRQHFAGWGPSRKTEPALAKFTEKSHLYTGQMSAVEIGQVTAAGTSVLS